jgi:hypothetical protein
MTGIGSARSAERLHTACARPARHGCLTSWGCSTATNSSWLSREELDISLLSGTSRALNEATPSLMTAELVGNQATAGKRAITRAIGGLGTLPHQALQVPAATIFGGPRS